MRLLYVSTILAWHLLSPH